MPESTPKYADPMLRDALLALHGQIETDDETLPELPRYLTIDDVRAFVRERIRTLIDTRRELLFSLLYRIDVSETAVLKVFAEASPSDVPGMLADLIVDRQLQKLQTRQKYASNTADVDSKPGSDA